MGKQVSELSASLRAALQALAPLQDSWAKIVITRDKSLVGLRSGHLSWPRGATKVRAQRRFWASRPNPATLLGLTELPAACCDLQLWVLTPPRPCSPSTSLNVAQCGVVLLQMDLTDAR